MKKHNQKYHKQNKNTIKENSLFISIKKKNNNLILYIFIAFVVPVLLYIQTVNYKFTNFDDNRIISNNITFLSNFKNASQAFTTDAFVVKISSFYRPMQTLSYMIDIQLSGPKETWMFHLSNILLLGLISCSLFLLLIRFLIPPNLALLSTLIYCIHPLFVSSIAWIPARGDLQLTLFSLLSFLFLIELFQKGKIIYLFLNWTAFTIALFCKETAAFLPFIFIIYYFTFYYKKRFDNKYLLIILLYFVSGILWLWLRSIAIGGIVNPKDNVVIISIIHNLRTIPESLVKFFIPYDIAPIPSFSLFKFLTGLVMISIIILLFRNKERSKKEKIFCLSWFIILMIPSMIYKHPYIDYLDHRFFLPMIGIMLFILFSFPKNWFVKGDIKRAWILIIILISLCSFTIIKSSSYTDPMTFYNTVISQNSNSVLAYHNRGNLKKDRADFKGAIEDFNKAIAIDPNFANPYNNRGSAKGCTGDNPGAIEDYNKAIAINPNYVEALFNRGVAKKNMGDNLGAIEDYNKAIAINPNYAEALYNRGCVKLNKIGDNLGAITDFNTVISITKKNADAYYNRGVANMKLGNFKEASEDYNKAIDINPNYADAYHNKGVILYSTGNLQEAIINFNYAIDIKPNYLSAYLNRAISKYHLKDLTGTIEDCENVLKLNPNNVNAMNLKTKAQQELQKKR